MVDTYDRTKFLIVKVSDDHMKVYLSVKPFAQENIDIKIDDVVEFLKTKTIASAINKELVKTTLDKVKLENFPIENILISEGTTVIHGDDGRLEFLFNAEKKIKPHKDTGGKVDFHNLSIVDSVEKDVDFGVGNITSKGTIVVRGNVRSGFVLDAVGDVEVWGTVEDSFIKSKGSVLIRGGFVGSGKGKIEAEGDVTVGFARNQTIVANNVTVLREAVDCTIYAKNIVKAGGDKISIEGGITTAGTLIEVEALGSKNEVYTDVEAGIDYTTHPDKINTRKEISGLKAFLKKVDKELNTLYAIKKARGELPAQYVATFDHHLSRREELVKKLRNLVSNEVVPVNADAKVTVNKVAHAGVEIKIGEPAITLLEECTRLTFFLSDDEIKIKKM